MKLFPILQALRCSALLVPLFGIAMSVGVGCGVVDGDNVGSGESAQTGHYGYGHYGYGYGHYGSYGYGSYGYGYGGYGGGYGYP